MENEKDPKASSPDRKRKKMALGKGLGALIPAAKPVVETGEKRDYLQCDVSLIHPNPYQPRRSFSDEELAELSVSIREQGIIQPLVARKNAAGYELVAGERRLRAAKLAGLKQVPLVVREMSDTRMLEASLVENIQRENLNPVEEADAYFRLTSEFGLTQEQVAEKVGKSRPAVANFLRLRNLPPEIRDSLADGRLSTGHAKVLLGVEPPARQRELWRMILEKSLSVRETEQILERMKAEQSEKKKPPRSEDIYYADLSENLARHFGTRVHIRRKGKKGRVEIEFYSDDDLDRLIDLLNAR